jgi:hypothetical protein
VMSYGDPMLRMCIQSRRLHWGRILKGEKPADQTPDCALAQSKQQTVGNRHLHPVRRPQSSFLEHRRHDGRAGCRPAL